MSTIRIGTRPSPLALTQTRWVADLLRQLGHHVSLVEVATPGDRSNAAIPDLGAGVFVSALRTALEAGQIDVAVHSLKDLPVAGYGPGTLGPARVTDKDGAPELVVAAVPRREDPRDALVSRDGLTLGELPAGATVGTGSARRAAQIGVLGLGLQVVPIRGNVGTRLDLVATGQLDAVIAPASSPSAPSWLSWQPAAVPRSGHSPTSSTVTPNPSCPCVSWWLPRTAATSCVVPWSDQHTTRSVRGGGSPLCCAKTPVTYSMRCCPRHRELLRPASRRTGLQLLTAPPLLPTHWRRLRE